VACPDMEGRRQPIGVRATQGGVEATNFCPAALGLCRLPQGSRPPRPGQPGLSTRSVPGRGCRPSTLSGRSDRMSPFREPPAQPRVLATLLIKLLTLVPTVRNATIAPQRQPARRSACIRWRLRHARSSSGVGKWSAFISPMERTFLTGLWCLAPTVLGLLERLTERRA
jgi:hypothetical protein